MQIMEWSLEYYTSYSGKCPVKEFIDSLSPESKAKYICRTLVLLHGFTKKTNKTPSREIAIAEKRMNDYVKRKG
jgi:Phage derived protein Gp49-like (DUF891)